MNGISKYDPALHDEAFLANFFNALADGSLQDGGDGKTALVMKVKEAQRSSPTTKQLWYDFVTGAGTVNFDPNRHDDVFLRAFLDQLELYPHGPILVPPEIRERECNEPGKVFVARLDRTGVTEEMLLEHFLQYGSVKQVELKTDPQTGLGRGYAFVTFEDPAVAQMLLDNYTQNQFQGKWIDIKPANPPPLPGAAGAYTHSDGWEDWESLESAWEALDGWGTSSSSSGWPGREGWNGGSETAWQTTMPILLKGLKGQWIKGGGVKGGGKLGKALAVLHAKGEPGLGKGSSVDAAAGKGKGPDKDRGPDGEATEEKVTDTLFVGGLPRSGVTSESLLEHFQQFGPVKSCELKVDSDGQPRGFAYVTFEKLETAQAVLDNYENNLIGGKWVDCKPAAGQAPPSSSESKPLPMAEKRGPAPSGSVLRVRGLPFSAKQPEVANFFAGYTLAGEIVMKTGWDGRPTGEAFVEFASKEEALRAFNDLNFAMMGSRYVELLGATPEDTVLYVASAATAKAGGYRALLGRAGRPRPGPYS